MKTQLKTSLKKLSKKKLSTITGGNIEVLSVEDDDDKNNGAGTNNGNGSGNIIGLCCDSASE
ncbi:bacteriocin [Chryseobacterium pennipullorum]|uniref:Uncharacterized protein n=1 Tax=Chryseobacterium pennipullorum TaxID=2258963 RepID=A0A3D9B1R0_9FLAO|nr:bacteriocin [Chryseobacterium pennipullorum]REC47247.1 hypothetical protein DRF67_11540 [Chryseobacterium pennipullorum]